jgi:glycosyltransferase involved in cell wall biosynthesis
MSLPFYHVLIVMPAYNEEEVISAVVAEVRLTLPSAHILVVSDGSTDSTVELAKAAGAETLELPFNLGVGGAMRLGFRYAELHRYTVAVQLDSDGQHNPADVPALVAALEECDVAIGARFSGSGNYVVRGPRKWAMRLLSTTLSRALGTKLTDTTSGFKAHGPRAIRVFARDFPVEYLGDTVEALVIGHNAGLRFAQRGVAMLERAGGTPSHNPGRSAIYLFRALLALAIAFLRPKSKTRLEA